MIFSKSVRRLALSAIMMTAGLTATASCATAACTTDFTSARAVKVSGAVQSVLIDSQCTYVYAANQTLNRIEVYQAKTAALVATIPVGAKPSGMDFSPSGTTLYVANGGENTISVVDLARRVETRKVNLTLRGASSAPYSLAVAQSGLVLLTTTFSGSGYGGWIYQIDPASYAVTQRNDMGPVTEAARLSASQDRSVIGLVLGDTSNGPIYKYTSSTNSFGPQKEMNSFVSSVAFDRTGSVALVGPGIYVLDANLSLSGSISAQGVGGAVDYRGTVGYQSSSSGIDVLDLVHFLKIASLATSDTLSKINRYGFTSIGQLAISADGALLAVITDNGFALVRSSYGGTVTANNGGGTGSSGTGGGTSGGTGGGTGGGAPSTPEEGTPGICTASFTSPFAIKLSGEASDVLIDDDCANVYVANATANRVEVYSARTGALRSTIAVGSKPASLDTTLDGKTLYVANSGGNNISVVDTARAVETGKINVPAGQTNDTPYSLAVSDRGVVLFTTTFSGSGFGARMMQYDPRTKSVIHRTDFNYGGYVTEVTRVKASSDRSVIAISSSGLSPASIYKYTSLFGTFSDARKLTNSESSGHHYFALSKDGSVGLAGPASYVQHRAAYILDAGLNIAGTVPGGGRGYGLAVDPQGTIGYQVQESKIDVLNLARFSKIGELPLGDSANARTDRVTSTGRLAISRDGGLLAVTTANGVSLVKGAAYAQPPLRVVALSSSTSNQSRLIFYNAGQTAGTVNVSLTDITTGKTLAQWTSPGIAPGTAPEFPISTIEASASQPFTKPAYYSLSVQSTMKGTFTHVALDATTGALINMSTCDGGSRAVPTRIANVNNSLFNTTYPSGLILANTGAKADIATLGIFDADSGARVGTYTSPSIAAGGGLAVAVSTLENSAGITPTTIQHYVVKIESAFSGYLQQIIVNAKPGVLTDMTAACNLPAS